MRALIRAEIRGCPDSFPDRGDRREYDAAVIQLVKDIGYDARHLHICLDHLPTQQEMEASEDVAKLFEGVPDPVKTQELKHLVMLGYTSEGQAKFVVCSINQNVLHIRVRDDLFDKLKRACKEICMCAWRHALKRSRLFRLIRRKTNWHLYLFIRGPIEVMEPNHSHATILGHLVRKPLNTLIRHHPGESFLVASALILSLLLFWYTPDWAPSLTQLLIPLKKFEPQYVQGLLERVYSALLVTFFITALDLAVKYRELYRNRPILWNAGIEPTKPTAK